MAAQPHVAAGRLESDDRRIARVDLLLAAIAALAVLPRLSHASASLWNDETFATGLWLRFDLGGFAWMAYDTHPPLYSLVMLAWIAAFGDGEASIRSLPLLCSVASVFVAGRIGAVLMGPAAGVLAAAMFALSGSSVFYAQEARSYSLVVLLFLLMTWFLCRHLAQGRARDAALLFGCAVAASAAHVYALLFVACFFALCAACAERAADGARALRMAAAVLGLAVPSYFSIALMLLFTSEHAYLWRGVTGPFGPGEAAGLLSFYLFGHGGLNEWRLAHVIAAALFVWGVAAAWRRGPALAGARGELFAVPWLAAVFAVTAAVGLAGSLLAAFAPLWLDARAVQDVVGGRHPELVSALPALLGRTGTLYALGYAGLAVAWVLLGRRWPRLGARWDRWRGRIGLAGLTAQRVVTGLPALAIALVFAISQFRPTFNNRYMMALLPFVVLTVARAVVSLAAWRPAGALGAILLLAAQGGSLARQDEAFALLKPDYKGALRYAARPGAPACGMSSTALWELENVSRYYVRRREVPPPRLVDPAAAANESCLVVLVPHARPLDRAPFPALRDRVLRDRPRAVSFAGLTVYEPAAPAPRAP